MLYHLSETLLDPGDLVVCGAPSYFVYLGALESLGAQAVGVDIDRFCIIPEALEDRLTRLEAAGELGRVKIIYVTTYHDNPSGVTTSAQRRAELLEITKRWSRRGKIYLIEDAAYRELRYYGDDIRSLHSFDEQGETVIHVGTFSKSFSPGIRIGWGILPPRLVEPLLARKGHLDFGSANFNQTIMAAVMEMGLFDEHLKQLRDGYRAKIDAMLEAAEQLLAPIGGIEWVRPTGGLYVWLRLPDSIDTGISSSLFRRAVDEGVLYVPGEYCYPSCGREPTRNMIRLSFGIQSCRSIHRGIESLARAIRGVS